MSSFTIGRKLAIKAKRDDFTALLTEQDIQVGQIWNQVKKGLEDDQRYQAIPSLDREQIFSTFMARLTESKQAEQESTQTLKKEEMRKKRYNIPVLHSETEALKDREEQVRKERAAINKRIQKSSGAVAKEEAELALISFLIDKIHALGLDFSQILPELERDVRYDQIRILSRMDMQKIYSNHMDTLFIKHATSIQELLDRIMDPETLFHISWSDVWKMIKSDVRVSRIVKNVDNDTADDVKRFKTWFLGMQRQRIDDAFKELRVSLAENALISHHVNSVMQGVDALVAEREIVEEVDVMRKVRDEQVLAVLEDDRRYKVLERFPSERERIVDEHLKALVEKARLEKGGTMDRIIAANAGGRMH